MRVTLALESKPAERMREISLLRVRTRIGDGGDVNLVVRRGWETRENES